MDNHKYHLAQINIAIMHGESIEDAIMESFINQLDTINGLAESSPGFVWRYKDEEDHSLLKMPYSGSNCLINLSVWKDVESLKQFTYNTAHAVLIKNKNTWFRKQANFHYALWWLPRNKLPNLNEAIEKLEYLQKNGSTQNVFDFKNSHKAPQ